MADEFGFDTGIGILHLEACDCKPAAQRVLSTLSLDHGAGVTRKIQHVCSNIMHRIPKAAKRRMEELFPKVPPMQLKASGGPDEYALSLQLELAREILKIPTFSRRMRITASARRMRLTASAKRNCSRQGSLAEIGFAKGHGWGAGGLPWHHSW